MAIWNCLHWRWLGGQWEEEGDRWQGGIAEVNRASVRAREGRRRGGGMMRRERQPGGQGGENWNGTGRDGVASDALIRVLDDLNPLFSARARIFHCM